MGSKILSIYPTILTTKIALYDGEKETKRAELRHDPFELFNRPTMKEQNDVRYYALEKFINGWITRDDMPDAVIGCALLKVKMPAGIYALDSELLGRMLGAQSIGRIINHGAMLASKISESFGVKPYALVPFATDELDTISKISGVPGLRFGRMTQTLHIKNAVRLAASDLQKSPNDVSLVIAYLGKNFSLASHSEGRIRDFSNTFERGPFSRTRSGALPASELIRMAYSGGWSKTDLLKSIYSSGGMSSYAGTDDLKSVISLMEDGDAYSSLLIRAMLYQLSAEIASLATTIYGKTDAVVLTGEYALYQPFARLIGESVSWIAKTLLSYSGEDELAMIAGAAFRALQGVQALIVCE